MAKREDLVLFHSATSPSEAELVRSILEGEGLMAVIPERNLPLPGVDLTPLDGQHRGTGCEVHVRPKDLERARELVAEARAAGELTGDDDEDAGTEDEGDDSEE